MLHHLTLPPTDRELERFVMLWSQAFAGPPWYASADHADDQREVIEQQLGRRSSHAAVLTVDDDRLVGAGWTWKGDDTPDDELHATIGSAVDDADSDWMFSKDTVVLVELMVHPNYQGQGRGRRLLDALTGDSPAWLLTHPDGAGVRLYRRTGWTSIGSLRHRGTPLDIMASDKPTPPKTE